MRDYYVSVDRRSSKRVCYHLKHDCDRLNGTTRPVTMSEIRFHEMRLCQYCNPNIPDPQNRAKQTLKYQNALKEASND